MGPVYITDIEWCHEVNMCASFKCIESYATKCNGFYSDGQGVVQEVWSGFILQLDVKQHHVYTNCTVHVFEWRVHHRDHTVCEYCTCIW